MVTMRVSRDNISTAADDYSIKSKGNNVDDDVDEILAIVYALHSVDMNIIETNEKRRSFAESAASIIPAPLLCKQDIALSSTLPFPMLSSVSDSTHSSFSSTLKQDQNEWFFTGITSHDEHTFHYKDNDDNTKEDKLPSRCHFTCDIEEHLISDSRKYPGQKLVLPPSSVLFDDDVATITSEVTNRDFPASPPPGSRPSAPISNASSRWSSSCSLDSPIKARPTPGSYRGTYRPPIGREAFTQLASQKQKHTNDGNNGVTNNSIQQGKKDNTADFSANNSPNSSRHPDNNGFDSSTVSDEILAQIFQEEEIASFSTSMSSIGVFNDSYSNLESMLHDCVQKSSSTGNKKRFDVDEWNANNMSQNLPNLSFNSSISPQSRKSLDAPKTRLSHLFNSTTMNTTTLNESVIDSDALYALEIQRRLEDEVKEQQKRMELQDEEIAKRLSEDIDDMFLKDIELARRLSEEIEEIDNEIDKKEYIVSPKQDVTKRANNNALTDSFKDRDIKEQSNIRDSVNILRPEILRKTNSLVRQISEDTTTTISSKHGESCYTSPDRAFRTTIPLKHGGELYTNPDRAFRTTIPLKHVGESYACRDRAFRRDSCHTFIKPEILRGQHNPPLIQKNNSPLKRNVTHPDIQHERLRYDDTSNIVKPETHRKIPPKSHSPLKRNVTHPDIQYESLRYDDTSNIIQPETHRKSPPKSYPSGTIRVRQVSSHRREIDDYQAPSLRHEVLKNTRPSNNNGSIYERDNPMRRATTGHYDIRSSSRVFRRDAASTSLLQPEVIRRNDNSIKQSKYSVIDGQPKLSVRRVVVDQTNAMHVQRLRQDLGKIMRSSTIPQQDSNRCKDVIPSNHRKIDHRIYDDIDDGSDGDSFSSDLQDYLDRVQDMIRTSR